jgi:hypothetical protein
VAYYPDLSSCSYFDQAELDKLISIGWLDEAHPYAQGEACEAFIDKLIDLLVKPWAPMHLLGYHDCPWCGDNYSVGYRGRSIDVGALNLFIPGEGFLYVMPSLAAHYIVTHGYAPPAPFREAVLQCPPMRSKEYFEAIVANGPPRYAGMVKKKYLTDA